MFQLIFAEDERADREGIMDCIPWEELGISVIAACKNGKEAYETALQSKPDILLTDIRMAQMDGLSLTQKILEQYPECSVLIISGYTETEYLKSAISFHVVDYINKPVELSALTESLKLAVSIQQEKLEKQELLRHKLSSMLCYPHFDYAEAVKLLSTLFPSYQESTAVCDCYLNVLTPSLERISEAQLYSLLPDISGLLSEMGLPCLASVHRKCILLSALQGDCWDNVAWEKIFQKLTSYFSSLRFYLCIGKPFLLKEYDRAVESADDSLTRLFFCSEEQHLIFGNSVWAKIPAKEHRLDSQPFSDALSGGDLVKAKDFVRTATHQITTVCKFTPIKVAEFYNQLFHILYKKTLSWEDSKTPVNAYDLLDTYVFCFLLEQQLLHDIDICFSSLSDVHQKLNLAEIEKYIEENYSDHDLSLEQVSKHFFMSTTWFCIHFKETVGKTFVRYLTEYRITRSLELLAKTDMKINDIAEQTGFNDSNYFTKIFKREMGITPKEFRKKMMPE